MVIYPVRGRDLAIGKLTRFHLAHQDSSSVNKPLNGARRPSARGIQAVVRAISVAGSDPSNVKDIFHAKPDPGYWL